MDKSPTKAAIVTHTHFDVLWTDRLWIDSGVSDPYPQAGHASAKLRHSFAPTFDLPNAILTSNCNRYNGRAPCRGRTCELNSAAKPASSALKNRLSQRAQNPPHDERAQIPQTAPISPCLPVSRSPCLLFRPVRIER